MLGMPADLFDLINASIGVSRTWLGFTRHFQY